MHRFLASGDLCRLVVRVSPSNAGWGFFFLKAVLHQRCFSYRLTAAGGCVWISRPNLFYSAFLFVGSDVVSLWFVYGALLLRVLAWPFRISVTLEEKFVVTGESVGFNNIGFWSC